MEHIKLLKWASTAAVLSGIVLTNLNIFPLNILIHGSGALGWTIAGYLTKDRALLTNFCLWYCALLDGRISFFNSSDDTYSDKA